MNVQTDYECRITVPLRDAGKAEAVARKRSDYWATSQIDGDPVLGDAVHYYLTAHDHAFYSIFGRMKSLKAELVEAGVEVLRLKIEQIVYDSRRAAGSAAHG